MEKTLFKIANTISEQMLNWVNSFIEMLPNMIVAFLLVILFSFIAKFAKKISARLLSKITDNQSLNRLAQSIIYIAILTLGVFIALSVLQLEKTVTSLLAGVGVIGLALGFAFQETAANFMSGIFLAVKRPFKIGEIIGVGDIMGAVKQLDLRTTTIESFDGHDVIIPNKDLFQGTIINYSANGKFRHKISVGVSYGDDLEKAKKVTQEAVRKVQNQHPHLEADVWYEEFGASSINLVVLLWIPYSKGEHFWSTRNEAIINIKQAYDEADITIPFPIRTLDFGIKGGEKLNTMLAEQKTM